MITFQILIAGYCVKIQAIHEYTKDLCRDYICEYIEPDMIISIFQNDIAYERLYADRPGYSDSYLESLAIYRKLCEKLIEKNILLIHSSAIAVDGKAYLFTAPSGTGKTTHTKLWCEKFGERAVIINGDKPLLSVNENEVRVWGTPWDGKEHLSTNTSALVAGICILTRGTENKIRKLSPQEAFTSLFAQTYRPKTVEGMQKTMELLTKMAEQIPLWKLECNMNIEAADVAYEAMKGK